MRNLLPIRPKVIFILILLTLQFLIVGCRNDNPHRNEEDSKDEASNNSDTSSQEYKLRKVFKIVLGDLKKNNVFNYDEAIPPAYVRLGQFLFTPLYGATINPNLSSLDFSVRWSDINNILQLSAYKDSADYYVAFYYLVNNENTSNKYFTYVVSIAKHDTINGKDTITPISTTPNSTFFMLSNSSPYYELITFDQFQHYATEYNSTVNYYSVQTDSVFPVQAYYHPLISYHKTSSFYTFYEHNRDSVPAGEELRLKIVNVVEDPDDNITHRTSGNSYNDFCQAPVSFFHAGNKVFLSNKEGQGKYTYKALNVGRLCPPQCD